jgi:hypothetical protein
MSGRRYPQVSEEPPAWWLTAFGWGIASTGFTEALLPGTRVFDSREAARAAWVTLRRQVWASTPRLKLPEPAAVFDQLSDEGRNYLWYRACEPNFSPAEARVAIERDREAVVAFEARDPDGAADVADYLRLWRDDLSIMEALIPRAAAVAVRDYRAGESMIYGPLCVAKKYADG